LRCKVKTLFLKNHAFLLIFFRII